MNQLQLRNLCYSWLDDLNGTYFLPAQVNVWLNNAQREVQKQLIQSGDNWYTIRASTSTVQNQDTYAVPMDFLKINKLEVLLSGQNPNQFRTMVVPVTLVQLDQVSMTAGTPGAYCLRKNCIVMRPIPDNIYTLYLDYTYRVADMTANSSIPDVPAQYHEYLAVLATLDGLTKDGRDPTPMLTKKDYYLSLMKQDSNDRNVDAPRTVVVTDGCDFGTLY